MLPSTTLRPSAAYRASAAACAPRALRAFPVRPVLRRWRSRNCRMASAVAAASSVRRMVKQNRPTSWRVSPSSSRITRAVATKG